MQTSYPAEYLFEPSDVEKAEGTVTEESLSRMRDIFDRTGILLVKDVITQEETSELFSAWQEHYPRLASGPAPDVSDQGSLPVGDKRAMVAVELKGPFGHSRVYANPIIMPLLRSLLGPRCVLANFTCVVSYPGSKAQHKHADHPHLFSDEIGMKLPCYALTVVLPLVDLSESNGTTALWPYSHQDEAAAEGDPVQPMIARGSAYLMDYRTVHHGMPNNGDLPRPVLYLVYSRPWFRDDTNFWRFNPLLLPPGMLETVPPHVRHVFANVAPELTRPFNTIMPQLKQAMALLEENGRDYDEHVKGGKPLPVLSLEVADGRLFEVVRSSFADADPRLADVIESIRRYIDQANKHMVRDSVSKERRGEAIKGYLAHAIVADVGESGPRHSGLYVAAVQRIEAEKALNVDSYRALANG